MAGERSRAVSDRVTGAVLGSAAGDALGAGYEFTNPAPDQEIAMIALRQSPYGPLFACADRCAVEPGFVQELRSLDRAALSDTLNSPSESTRSDPITQIIGLLQLIDQATRPIAFGQVLRILKICGELDDLYHTASLERAAEELAPLLERHLLSSYPGLPHYEPDAVQSHIDRLLATYAPGTLKVQR